MCTLYDLCMTIWCDDVLCCIAIVKGIIFSYVILLHLQKIYVKMIIPIWSLDFPPLCASYIVQTLFVPVVIYTWYKYNPYLTENKNFCWILFRCLKSVFTWTQNENWTEINFSVGWNVVKYFNIKCLISKTPLKKLGYSWSHGHLVKGEDLFPLNSLWH